MKRIKLFASAALALALAIAATGCTDEVKQSSVSSSEAEAAAETDTETSTVEATEETTEGKIIEAGETIEFDAVVRSINADGNIGELYVGATYRSSDTDLSVSTAEISYGDDLTAEMPDGIALGDTVQIKAEKFDNDEFGNSIYIYGVSEVTKTADGDPESATFTAEVKELDEGMVSRLYSSDIILDRTTELGTISGLAMGYPEVSYPENLEVGDKLNITIAAVEPVLLNFGTTQVIDCVTAIESAE